MKNISIELMAQKIKEAMNNADPKLPLMLMRIQFRVPHLSVQQIKDNIDKLARGENVP